MMPIYLDNNATTQPALEVIEVVKLAMEKAWANPSSVHRAGQGVRHQVELARSSLARLLRCRERELVFTSGGTEANNLALRGILSSPAFGQESSKACSSQPLLITTRIEHAAIRQPAEALQAQGVRLVHLPVSSSGRLEPGHLKQVLEQHGSTAACVLVSLQWANNETGVIQPIPELAEVISQYRQDRPTSATTGTTAPVYFHVDATQAVGKLPVHLDEVAVDLLTLAAHKFHGPKGIGALFVRQGVRLQAQQTGGPQERDRRGGTENSPGILGLGVAAELAEAFLRDHSQIQRLQKLRDRLEQSVCAALPGTVIHAREVPRLWNTTNLGFPSLEAEAILVGLSERGVYASAGAACSSGSLEPSPVLLAMGIPPAVAHGSVRFSLSRCTTEEEIDQAIELIPQVVCRLRQVLPMGV